jgi:hypothetical protein
MLVNFVLYFKMSFSSPWAYRINSCNTLHIHNRTKNGILKCSCYLCVCVCEREMYVHKVLDQCYYTSMMHQPVLEGFWVNVMTARGERKGSGFISSPVAALWVHCFPLSHNEWMGKGPQKQCLKLCTEIKLHLMYVSFSGLKYSAGHKKYLKISWLWTAWNPLIWKRWWCGGQKTLKDMKFMNSCTLIVK